MQQHQLAQSCQHLQQQQQPYQERKQSPRQQALPDSMQVQSEEVHLQQQQLQQQQDFMLPPCTADDCWARSPAQQTIVGHAAQAQQQSLYLSSSSQQ
eukprot:13308-Heterococcus_DN1.PRE.4